MITATRNANLQDMRDMLTEQRVRRHDIIVPGGLLSFRDGQLVIAGAEPAVDENGVTEVNGTYSTTDVFDGGLAQRLDIPIDLIRRMKFGREDAGKRKVVARPDLFDGLVNGYLQGRKAKTRFDRETGALEELAPAIGADSRMFTVRLWLPENGEGGVARALLSNQFAIMDNLDALAAMIQGFNDAGLDASKLIISGDLSEKRMYIKVQAPEVFTLAPELLNGYRSPFNDGGIASQRFNERVAAGQQILAEQGDGHGGIRGQGHNIYARDERPIIHAGFIMQNSEVGQGTFSIGGQVVVLACSNGLTQTEDMMARRHVGAALEAGAVDWSARTQSKNIDLITSMTQDAVETFLSKDYVEKTVEKLTAKSGKRIEKPQEVIEHIGKVLKFDDATVAGIMEHFFTAGQRTSGGVMQAVTSYSQTVELADEAYELDAVAVQAMELAYAAS
jgi:hypothetical protein